MRLLPHALRQLATDTWRLPQLPAESPDDATLPGEGDLAIETTARSPLLRTDAYQRARGALHAAETLLDDQRSPVLSHSAEGVISLLSLSIAWSARAHDGATSQPRPVPLHEGISAGVPPTTRELAERALEASPEEIARASERTLRTWIAATTEVAKHALGNAIPGAKERAALARRRRRGLALRLLIAVAVIAFVVLAGRRLYLGPDLTTGLTWTPSSRYLGYQRELGLVDGNPAALLFHTNLEANPHAVIDLGATRTIRRVRIQNRKGFEARALPLIVETSVDGAAWEGLTKREEWFLVWAFRIAPREARYVRLRTATTTFLHLEAIEIR